MFTPEIAQVLLTIILVLAVLVGIAVLIALALAIKTVFEIFALVRAVRSEVATIGSAVRSVGEGVISKLGIVSGITSLFSGNTARKAPGRKKNGAKA